MRTPPEPRATHSAQAGAAQAAANGSGPALSSAAARRGHGQHAARHGKGKPARRWRGNNTTKSAAQGQQAQGQQAQTPTAQAPTSDAGPAAEAAEAAETSTPDSRAPWERGDAR